MSVTKRNGREVKFNFSKIKSAVSKAAASCGGAVASSDLKELSLCFDVDAKYNVEDIQNIVERWLMDRGLYKIAKAFILYREEHKKARFVKERLAYIDKYVNSGTNASTASETDVNANVMLKNVANLEGEVYKIQNRQMQREHMFKQLTVLYPEVAKQYEKDLDSHILYTHDESCSPVQKPYCMAASLYPLMTKGVGNVDGVTPNPPNDIKSYSGQVTNLIFSLSSQVKGAVAASEYLIALNYYVIAEFGNNWYEHIDDVVSTPLHKKTETIRTRIYDGFKQFIWGINQPAGNRSYQSPFTNISYFDKVYFNSLFGEFRYPDGSEAEWKAIDTLQRMFMKFFNKLRLSAVLTFPVETFAMVYDTESGDIIDNDYKELCAEMYADGHSFFTYLSDSADSLSSCCRLKNEIKENTFSPTSGMTGVMTGSCNVISLNINRIVQDWYRDIKTGVTVDYIPFKEEIASQFGTSTSAWVQSLRQYICNILDRTYKYHIAYKSMLYDLEDKGMYTSSNAGYIYLKKLYSTIGINGLNEAAQFFGLSISNNEEYIHFLQLILGTIKEQNKLYSIQDKKRPYIFNSEVVPAEGLGVKNYNWDKNDGYWVPEDKNLYNSYFYDAHDNATTILDKFQLHGRKTFQFTDGGSALHCNLDSHLSKSQYLKLIDYAVKNGTSYFTFNVPNSKCNSCGNIVKIPISKCPKCGGSDITQYTRVIGYLRPVTSFGKDRQVESSKRFYSDGKTEINEEI
jgi:anaerobic ribonucleoside-triphosphate reductase